MTLNKGDYILFDYTVVVKDDNKVIETTNEATAKEAGIYRPEEVYEPRLVILGETKLWEPLENALLNADEGKDVEVEIPPEKAYGQRDLSKIKILSIREFHRHGIVPRVDDVVEIEGNRARVISISGGRVTLDFNHPLAGKTLVVRGKVVRKLTSNEEKIVYLIRQYMPRIPPDKISVSFSQDGSEAQVRLPAEVLLYEKIGNILLQAASEIGSRFAELKKVNFVEEVELKR
ncbi:peptidylprolyl isomerase, FKBP-type [Thermoproteus uzoniensis 768-20]|uniref:Peptidyl-prolyl cis-trans isomerase n=1 Tax=Thermoproteus uzoniensis (strain 768-20) TaxID=999630 RepID=F2L2J4_THEU7|nr:peptidylprolyl isomerase [Thermoproteus uzoniensis]AEA13042.1 peptidylprolyl isomerase, FKBP-type [Thermoproteus uzoniensis 768-20]